MDPQTIYTAVNSRYSNAALTPARTSSSTIAHTFGYTSDELTSIPSDSNLGLSCGNPLALAALSPGETVIDLGSGAGFDVFLAAKRVGPTGKAIGVDMNDAMLARANANLEKLGAEGANISFVKSTITDIALADGVAHCIISNCVVNLVPESEKPLVFREIFRLLKSGGRVAISDILAKRPLPEEMKRSMALYVGCIAGAAEVGEYDTYLRDAGFSDMLIVDAKNDLNVYKESADDECSGGEEKKETESSTGCCGNSSVKDDKACCDRSKADCCDKKDDCDRSCCGGGDVESIKDFVEKYKDLDFNEWVGSFKVYAVKP